jgi:hypothetical protein
MSPLPPIADHGSLVTALPFVAPMVLVVTGLVALVLRDRLGRRNGDRSD